MADTCPTCGGALVERPRYVPTVNPHSGNADADLIGGCIGGLLVGLLFAVFAPTVKSCPSCPTLDQVPLGGALRRGRRDLVLLLPFVILPLAALVGCLVYAVVMLKLGKDP